MKEKEEKKVSLSRAPEYAPGRGFFFLFLLTALGIHLFLFLLFRPISQAPLTEKSASKNHTVLILQDAPDYPEKLRTYRLDYALRFLEPQKAILPDLQGGFSSVLTKRSSRALLPDIKTTLPPEGPAEKKDTFLLPERKLGELSPGLSRYPVPPVRSPGPSAGKPVQLPHWKLGESTFLSGLPEADPASDELLHQYAPRAKGPTRLRVDHTDENLPPVIEIRSSCAIAELDQLAVRQLALYIGRNPSLFRGKMPAFCSVLWCLPKMKRSSEVIK